MGNKGSRTTKLAENTPMVRIPGSVVGCRSRDDSQRPKAKQSRQRGGAEVKSSVDDFSSSVFRRGNSLKGEATDHRPSLRRWPKLVAGNFPNTLHGPPSYSFIYVGDEK